MLKITSILTFLIIGIGFKPIPPSSITVKVTVTGKDDRITNKILSDLRSDLRNKSNVVIARDNDDSSTFSLFVQYSTIKSGDDLVGFFMSSILTKRIRTAKNEKGEILLNHTSSSTVKESDIESICSNLVDQYDVKYFEKERQ